MALQLRPMTLGDALEVARLSGQLDYPTSEATMRGRLARLQSSPTHAMVAATLADRLVGWISGEERIGVEFDPRVEITGLVVDAGVRRQGIGRLLVSEIERWAVARGCGAIVVRSNIARTESHLFYGQLGYERVKSQHTYRRRLGAVEARN